MRGLPRRWNPAGPSPFDDIFVGVITTGLVLTGYKLYLVSQASHILSEDKSLILVLPWMGGIFGLFWLAQLVKNCRPDIHAAVEEKPLIGWEVSFGVNTWRSGVNPWTRHGRSSFREWRQALGLVHFVDGLVVLHARAKCDNGGTIEAKLVLVPRGGLMVPSPVVFWNAVEMATLKYRELVDGQAKHAAKPEDINLNKYDHCDIGLRHDTEILYFPPPIRYQPIH